MCRKSRLEGCGRFGYWQGFHHAPSTHVGGKQPPELFSGFAQERVGLQAARVDRWLRVMRDCADIRMRKMCSAGPVTECLRPVLHHAAQRTALHAMQPML